MTLRALRIASDRTAETVALRASMSPAKFSKTENGKTLPSVQDVDLIPTLPGQLIPGLPQSAEYVSAAFALHPELPEGAKARTIAARLERQAVLHERQRQFHFLICEHVLRWRICPPAVMATQLDRLVIVGTFHSEITTHDPRDVDVHLSKFSEFDAVALHGDDIRALAEGIRDEFLRE
ncbi:Scr1 family TA system antitoxin-like transcriptional regulator [Kitasatospora sp. NPDC057940]|uniref:Scr1 family TA system antitoxin-like transcriptional regulator n=1 Tax=Kitasatospora sp. NPDC057940 TaxID=3346285 RepID=UPI0036D8A92E